jgi:hypothetical protein
MAARLPDERSVQVSRNVTALAYYGPVGIEWLSAAKGLLAEPVRALLIGVVEIFDGDHGRHCMKLGGGRKPGFGIQKSRGAPETGWSGAL